MEYLSVWQLSEDNARDALVYFGWSRKRRKKWLRRWAYPLHKQPVAPWPEDRCIYCNVDMEYCDDRDEEGNLTCRPWYHCPCCLKDFPIYHWQTLPRELRDRAYFSAGTTNPIEGMKCNS